MQIQVLLEVLRLAILTFCHQSNDTWEGPANYLRFKKLWVSSSREECNDGGGGGKSN